MVIVMTQLCSFAPVSVMLTSLQVICDSESLYTQSFTYNSFEQNV